MYREKEHRYIACAGDQVEGKQGQRLLCSGVERKWSAAAVIQKNVNMWICEYVNSAALKNAR